MSFVDVPVSHGRLEGLLWKAERPKGAVVVCHPHPKFGGTMHNHVTYRVAQAFRDAGVSALRFNFRGVGRSTGTYDDGRGEVDDAAAALDFLAGQEPGVPLYAAGFSFGSRAALQLALRDDRVERVLAVGLAARMFDFGFLKSLQKRKAFIHGDTDEYASVAQVEQILAEVPEPKRLFVVSECDHLANGRLDAFLKVAHEAVGWLLEGPR